jgi:hypothetical protein
MRATAVLTIASLAFTALASGVRRTDLGSDYEHGDDSEECEDDGDWVTSTTSASPTYTLTSTHHYTPTTTVEPTTKWTTSTYYSTTIYTITSCPPTVHDCPGGGDHHVTTEIVPIGTTVCPVTEDHTPEPTPEPTGGYVPLPGSSTIITVVPTTTPREPDVVPVPTTTPPVIPIGSAGRVAAGGLLGAVVGVMALAL